MCGDVTAMPKYSIIIPAYNESARLGATLDRVLEHVVARSWDAEVIVVNDGSRDDTAEMVLARAQANPALRLVENPGNHGKGYSSLPMLICRRPLKKRTVFLRQSRLVRTWP
jgi:glycosyltransferase involved in cell wall biosynthesis